MGQLLDTGLGCCGLSNNETVKTNIDRKERKDVGETIDETIEEDKSSMQTIERDKRILLKEELDGSKKEEKEEKTIDPDGTSSPEKRALQKRLTAMESFQLHETLDPMLIPEAPNERRMTNEVSQS